MGTQGQRALSFLTGSPGLAILCSPWKAPVLILSLLEDEKVGQVLFHLAFLPYPQAVGGRVSACESQEVNSGHPFPRPSAKGPWEYRASGQLAPQELPRTAGSARPPRAKQ